MVRDVCAFCGTISCNWLSVTYEKKGKDTFARKAISVGICIAVESRTCVCKNESVTSATMRTRMQYKCSQKKALNLFHQLRKHQSRHNCWLHSLRASPFLFYHRMRWLNASALFCSSHLTIIPGLKIKPSFIYYNFICIIISRCSVCFCSFFKKIHSHVHRDGLHAILCTCKIPSPKITKQQMNMNMKMNRNRKREREREGKNRITFP